jgi:uncharacterized protein (TIGR00290 family)
MRAWLSWSSGKDSAFALHELRSSGEVGVEGLLTTVNETHGRVAMHAVRESLLRRQAEALGLPLKIVPIPYPCPNEVYEARMSAVLSLAKGEGIEAIAFGDLFLEDIRRYREERLAPTGIVPLFPLWGRPTGLAHAMLDAGLRATLTCVDPRHLPRSFAGREFSRELLADLPPGVDPCGERGEFHTFAWDGPVFRHAIETTPGEVVLRDGFYFADLVPSGPVGPRASDPPAG